jgi:hypothetical protein
MIIMIIMINIMMIITTTIILTFEVDNVLRMPRHARTIVC